jgi:hypothetical protein
MVYICNPGTQEAEEEGSQIQGYPGLYSKTLSQKRKTYFCQLEERQNSQKEQGQFSKRGCKSSSNRLRIHL